MKNKNINEAELEARRFLKRIAEYKEATAVDHVYEYVPSSMVSDPYCGAGCKQRAAIRRASMDLTRALAKMRQEII